MLNSDELDKKLDLLIEGESLNDEDSALSTAKAIVELPLPDIESSRRDKIKGMFLSEAAKNQATPIKAVRSWRILSGRRIAAVGLAIFMSSGATVYAASGSMPDSALYPIKRATEDAALFIAPGSFKSSVKKKLAQERKKEHLYMSSKKGTKKTKTKNTTQEPSRDGLNARENSAVPEMSKKKIDRQNQMKEPNAKNNSAKTDNNKSLNQGRRPAKGPGTSSAPKNHPISP